MDKFIPTEVKDLTESKKRVMRNVLNEVQNKSKKPKHNWRYAVIAALVTMSAILFVLNEVLTENEPSVAEQPSPTELHIDLSKPAFSEEQGVFYLDGVTLGDSESKVIEVFGENFTIVQEDGSEADVVLDYDGQAKFSFIEDKLISILFMNVDEDYFDELFKGYDGFKFIDFHIYDDHFFYSNGTNQIVKASPQPIDESLSLKLSYAEPHWEKKVAENLYKTQQNIKNQHISPTNTDIDYAKPTFTEEEGYLYFHGVTLGDSPSKVIDRLGDNYIIGQADGSGSDFLLNYDRLASFHFYNDKLDSIVLIKVDKEYFDELFNHYEGFKFISSGRGEDDNDRIIYSEETYQVLKATTQTPNNDLYLYIGYPGPELWDNPEMKGIPDPWQP
ncbi:hypothetical protein [Sporosarcina highlanderae]|uniref:DUF4179 domain-containing protein n=1 Tax=Sporosarcina highlanderae TaxID=3035916 RepID=A0ABT8JUN5_9BACL|nr:hypothetical protein [Sporosarcina highlanderae]MDN4608850.1 hypothetical protein [Sporosarcina highlanderae]